MLLNLREVEFADQRRFTRYSNNGTPYTVLRGVGMPKIPDQLLESTFYLYSDKQSALDGVKSGGTGFVVAMPFSNTGRYFHGYAVTNRHNIKDNFSVIRINTREGGTEIFELDPADWKYHPDGHDIAIAPLGVDLDVALVSAILTEAFLTPQLLKKTKIAAGENVLMTGRFCKDRWI
jgi:hypothetical protein